MVRLQLPPAPPTLRRRTNDQQSIANSEPIAGSSNRRTAPFEGANAGAIPAPAANFRPVVITIREANFSYGQLICKAWEAQQNHVWPTPRSRRGRTFPGDQPSLCELRLGEP